MEFVNGVLTTMVNGEMILHGEVGFDFYSEVVKSDAAKHEGDLIVKLNSPGGNAFEGFAIYNILSEYDGKVSIHCEGIAASAASIIALAGDEFIMPKVSLFMIHNASTFARGDKKQISSAIKLMENIDSLARDIYAEKTNLSPEKITEMMDDETWLKGVDAVSLGFATSLSDSETQEEKISLSFSVPEFDYSKFKNAPQALLDGVPSQAPLKTGAEAPKLMEKKIMLNGNDGGADQSTNNDGQNNVTTDNAKSDVLTVKQMSDMAKKVGLTADFAIQMHDQGKTSKVDYQEELLKASPNSNQKLEPELSLLEMSGLAKEFGLDADFAVEMFDKGVKTRKAFQEHVVNRRIDQNFQQSRPQQNILIVRDEGDTMREGMQAAITAQMLGEAPSSDVALDYMSSTLPEMALEFTGNKDRIRTVADKEIALQAGFHSTSDFPNIFNGAINEVLQRQYERAAPTYKKVGQRIQFTDFREHNLISIGDFPSLKGIPENGQIASGTFGEGKEKAIVGAYGRRINISRKMMVNDRLNAIGQLLNSYNVMISLWEEAHFYAFRKGAKLSDGKPVYHADHNNLASTASAITVEALGAGRKMMRQQKSIDGQKLNITASILLVGSEKETEAELLTAQIQPGKAADANPFSGKLETIAAAEIEGNEWELLPSPSVGSNFVWGLLDGYEAPRIRVEEPFGQQGLSMTVEHDFGVGAQDYRFGYKNSGK